MKKIFAFIFFICGSPVFCQMPDSGTWIIKDKKVLDSLHDDLFVYKDTSIFISDSAFVPIFNDSITNLYVYLVHPDMIQFKKHSMLLIYGDIMDPNSRIIVNERFLRSQEGDCIFAWEPSTSMYEYVISWSNDHFVYYTSYGTEYHYEILDTDILSQHQKERLIPKDEMWAYFQGRSRPIQSYYHCNIITEK